MRLKRRDTGAIGEAAQRYIRRNPESRMFAAIRRNPGCPYQGDNPAEYSSAEKKIQQNDRPVIAMTAGSGDKTGKEIRNEKKEI